MTGTNGGCGGSSIQLVMSLASLSTALTKEVLENEDGDSIPNMERCYDILQSIQKECPSTISKELIEKTSIDKIVNKTIESFQRHLQNTDDPKEQEVWKQIIALAEEMIVSWQKDMEQEEQEEQEVQQERKRQKLDHPDGNQKIAATTTTTTTTTTNETTTTSDTDHNVVDGISGFPASVEEYRQRLLKQSKELYQDPPILPPNPITVESEMIDPPIRRKNIETTTTATDNKEDEPDGYLIFHDYPEFLPNRTPEEVLRYGAFGGHYFAPITSAVTNIKYKTSQVLQATIRPDWISGLEKKVMVCSPKYQNHVNKYKVNDAFGSLGKFESLGQITEIDPYGWFQWYCRFYQGRRTSDDSRQIQLWLANAGPNGTLRKQLCEECIKEKKKADDTTVNPVIRQTLLHWGFELTEEILEDYKKSKQQTTTQPNEDVEKK